MLSEMKKKGYVQVAFNNISLLLREMRNIVV